MDNKEKLKEYLKSLKFSVEDIEDLLDNLENEIDQKDLHEKIKFLISLKLDIRVIRIIIEENPLFMTTTLNEIKDIVELLESLKLKEYISDILEMNPEILSTSKEKIATNINLLKIIIPEEMKFFEILKERTEIFTYNTEYLEKRLEFFVKNDLKDQIYKIILKYSELFDEDEEDINIKRLKEELA